MPRPSRPDVDVPGLAAHAICAAPFTTGRRRTWPRCSRHMCRALRDRTSTYLASLLTPYVPRPSRPDVDVPGLAAHAICAASFTTGHRRTWLRCSRHMCRAAPFVPPTALLTVPRHSRERYGRRSFSRAGPTLWNALPEDLRLIEDVNTFKARLKTHYFKLTFNM